MQKGQILPKSGYTQVRIFNTINCEANVTLNGQNFMIEELGYYENLEMQKNQFETYKLILNATYQENCKYAPNYKSEYLK